MKTSDEGIALITSFEGLALKPYRCPAGKWTIGYGQRISEAQVEQWKDGITKQQALDLFRPTLKRHEQYVRNLLKMDVPQGVFDALVSFSYNCGPGSLRKTGIPELIRKDPPPDDRGIMLAAIQLSTSYIHAKGVILRDLVNRRYREAYMMAQGIPDAIVLVRENVETLYKNNWPDKPLPEVYVP